MLPGPLSFHSYLANILLPDQWGDSIKLTLISMMWQARITVVYGESLLQEKIRHNGALDNGDIVVVFCSGNHYVSAGKCQDQNLSCRDRFLLVTDHSLICSERCSSSNSQCCKFCGYVTYMCLLCRDWCCFIRDG